MPIGAGERERERERERGGGKKSVMLASFDEYEILSEKRRGFVLN